MNESLHPSETDIACQLRGLAAETPANKSLPDPHLLWMKAQLEERAALRERALRPIVIAERVVLVVFALLGGLVLTTATEQLGSWFGQIAEPEFLVWGVAGTCLLAVGIKFVLEPLFTGD